MLGVPKECISDYIDGPKETEDNFHALQCRKYTKKIVQCHDNRIKRSSASDDYSLKRRSTSDDNGLKTSTTSDYNGLKTSSPSEMLL